MLSEKLGYGVKEPDKGSWWNGWVERRTDPRMSVTLEMRRVTQCIRIDKRQDAP